MAHLAGDPRKALYHQIACADQIAAADQIAWADPLP